MNVNYYRNPRNAFANASGQRQQHMLMRARLNRMFAQRKLIWRRRRGLPVSGDVYRHPLFKRWGFGRR